MRRNTFGGGHLAHNNSLRRRLSGAFSAAAKDGGRERESPFPSASRVGSVSRLDRLAHSKKGEQGPLKDPRNLSNRGKQREMIEDILNFLQLNGYPHQISQKIMQAPTSKDFVKLFEFLYGFLDKREKIDKKFEEEVPRLLKSVHYPFPISKSAMFTIGSPHTWPTLLGALHWLVKLIEYCQSVVPEELMFCQNRDEFNYGCDQFFEMYLQKAYQDFLQGKPRSEEDDLKLEEAIIHQTGGTDENHEALEKEVEELERELAELESEPDRLKELQDEMVRKKAECEKMDIQLRDWIIEEKELCLKDKKYEDELQNYDVGRIRQVQASGFTDVQQALLKNRVDAAKEENENMQKKSWEKEIIFSKAYNKVDKILSEYNDHVRNLSCDKTAMRYLNGSDLAMKFDHNEDFLKDSNKFKDTIKDNLIQAYSKISADIHQLEAERITEEDKLEKLTEFCIEKQRETSLSKVRLDNLTKEVEAFQMKATKEQETSEQDLAAIRGEIESLGNSSTAHLAKREQDLVDLKERKQLEETKMQEKEQKAAEFLTKVVQKTIEHKAKIEAGVEKMYKDKAEQVSKLEKQTYPWQNLTKDS